MTAADKARTEGHLLKARDGYRAAAAAYPSEHLPWVRLAQSYFEALDYGNAIVASEEALQRNRDDQTALGIMAVSGLRVSSRAVSSLSDKKSIGDSRSQAESIVRNLRDTVGEPALVELEPAPVVRITVPDAAPVRTGGSRSAKPPNQGQNPPTTSTGLVTPAVNARATSPTAVGSAAPTTSTTTSAPSTSTTPKKPSANPLEILR